MALNAADRARATDTRFDTRNRQGYMPYLIGAVALIAVLFYFFGGNLTGLTTAPQTTINAPQTTTPAPTPSPATR